MLYMLVNRVQRMGGILDYVLEQKVFKDKLIDVNMCDEVRVWSVWPLFGSN